MGYVRSGKVISAGFWLFTFTCREFLIYRNLIEPEKRQTFHHDFDYLLFSLSLSFFSFRFTVSKEFKNKMIMSWKWCSRSRTQLVIIIITY